MRNENGLGQGRRERERLWRAMPTILIIALRVGGTPVGSLHWYWRLSRGERQAANARTRAHIEERYGAGIWDLTLDQAKAVHRWTRAQHA